MSASKTKESQLSIEKLGIIAGGGLLPQMLVKSCLDKNIDPFILAFKGQTDPKTVGGINHIWTGLGALQKNVDVLRAQNISDIVFCGSIKKPSFISLKPDIRATKFLLKNGYKALGDNSLLTAIKAELEKDGLQFHGVHKFIDNVLAPEGVIGDIAPSDDQMKDIEYGFKVSQEHGRKDLGQSVIVENGKTLGTEDQAGTDALISTMSSGILVKTCKPQQDRDLDLPTIGLETIKQVVKHGLSGIAVHAQNTLILNREEIVAYANQNKIFIYGVGK